MKTWLTIRLDDDGLTALAVGCEDHTDTEDNLHTVTASVGVELSDDIQTVLGEALTNAGPALKKALTRTSNRHMTAVEDAIENRGILAKAAGAAKKVFGGKARAEGQARHTRSDG